MTDQNKKLVLIDFDGTITNKDSFLDFIIYFQSFSGLFFKALRSLPTYLGYKLRMIGTDKAKEKIFSIFFKHRAESSLVERGEVYCDQGLLKILRKDALEQLEKYNSSEYTVCVVTASAKYWVQPWCDKYGYDLICTQYETRSGKMTGKYVGNNCRGKEKVDRILEKYNLDKYSEIVCYGDTPDDLPMLSLGKKNYKVFKE